VAPAPAAADGEARVRFTVDLPRSLHKRLKLAAMNQELPMTDLARQALGEWLDSRG
jgi:predicted HicB family RNase H-like nuclease